MTLRECMLLFNIQKAFGSKDHSRLQQQQQSTKYKVPFNTVVIESVSCPLENFPLTQLITEKNHDFCKLKVIQIKKRYYQANHGSERRKHSESQELRIPRSDEHWTTIDNSIVNQAITGFICDNRPKILLFATQICSLFHAREKRTTSLFTALSSSKFLIFLILWVTQLSSIQFIKKKLHFRVPSTKSSKRQLLYAIQAREVWKLIFYVMIM